MSTEDVRSIIQKWAQALSSLDYTTLENLATPDATYWTSGPTDKIPFVGNVTYAERIGAMRGYLGRMRSLSITNLGIMVDGDLAALELAVRGEGETGKVYENSAIIKFVVKEGKIKSAKEYIDTSAVLKYMEE